MAHEKNGFKRQRLMSEPSAASDVSHDKLYSIGLGHPKSKPRFRPLSPRAARNTIIRCIPERPRAWNDNPVYADLESIPSISIQCIGKKVPQVLKYKTTHLSETTDGWSRLSESAQWSLTRHMPLRDLFRLRDHDKITNQDISHILEERFGEQLKPFGLTCDFLLWLFEKTGAVISGPFVLSLIFPQLFTAKELHFFVPKGGQDILMKALKGTGYRSTTLVIPDPPSFVWRGGPTTIDIEAYEEGDEMEGNTSDENMEVDSNTSDGATADEDVTDGYSEEDNSCGGSDGDWDEEDDENDDDYEVNDDDEEEEEEEDDKDEEDEDDGDEDDGDEDKEDEDDGDEDDGDESDGDESDGDESDGDYHEEDDDEDDGDDDEEECKDCGDSDDEGEDESGDDEKGSDGSDRQERDGTTDDEEMDVIGCADCMVSDSQPSGDNDSMTDHSSGDEGWDLQSTTEGECGSACKAGIHRAASGTRVDYGMLGNEERLGINPDSFRRFGIHAVYEAENADKKTIKIFESSVNSALAPIPFFDTSLLMNYIAYHGVVLLHPRSTVEGLGIKNFDPAVPLSDRTTAAYQSYTKNGFKFVEDLRTLEIFDRHVCNKSLACPGAHRRLTDEGVLHIPFVVFDDLDTAGLSTLRFAEEGRESWFEWGLTCRERCGGATISRGKYLSTKDGNMCTFGGIDD